MRACHACAVATTLHRSYTLPTGTHLCYACWTLFFQEGAAGDSVRARTVGRKKERAVPGHKRLRRGACVEDVRIEYATGTVPCSQLARKYGLSTSTVYQWVTGGRMLCEPGPIMSHAFHGAGGRLRKERPTIIRES